MDREHGFGTKAASHEPTPSPFPGGELKTAASNEAPLLRVAGGGFMSCEHLRMEQGAAHERGFVATPVKAWAVSRNGLRLPAHADSYVSPRHPILKHLRIGVRD